MWSFCLLSASGEKCGLYPDRRTLPLIAAVSRDRGATWTTSPLPIDMRSAQPKATVQNAHQSSI